MRLTAVSDPQHGGFTADSSPVSWGSLDELFVNLTVPVRGIVCSMSRRGNCYDNSVMESFFSTVKSELGEHFDSHGDAKMELLDYIEVFYNHRRRHSTTPGCTSP